MLKEVESPVRRVILYVSLPMYHCHHYTNQKAVVQLVSWIGSLSQLIGLREILQENPIFQRKIYGFRLRFSLKSTR